MSVAAEPMMLLLLEDEAWLEVLRAADLKLLIQGKDGGARHCTWRALLPWFKGKLQVVSQPSCLCCSRWFAGP